MTLGLNLFWLSRGPLLPLRDVIYIYGPKESDTPCTINVAHPNIILP